MSFANDALIALVRSRLMCDSRLASLPIDVHCADGYVCLVGSVETVAQKRLAVALVKGMIGVRNVKDQLDAKEARPITPGHPGARDSAVA